MRRRRYRIFLIVLAIIIVALGVWCISELNRTNMVIEGTFVYAE